MTPDPQYLTALFTAGVILGLLLGSLGGWLVQREVTKAWRHLAEIRRQTAEHWEAAADGWLEVAEKRGAALDGAYDLLRVARETIEVLAEEKKRPV